MASDNKTLYLIPNDLLTRVFTPGQIQGIEEFMTPDEEAKAWIIYNDLPTEVYKKGVRIEGKHTYYKVCLKPWGASLISTYELGVDAFDNEWIAIQRAKKQLREKLEPLMEKGKQLMRQQNQFVAQKGGGYEYESLLENNSDTIVFSDRRYNNGQQKEDSS